MASEREGHAGGALRHRALALGAVAAAVVAGVLAATLALSSAHPVADRSVDGCLSFSVRTDRPSYRPGVPVHILVTATDVSTHGCRGRPCGGITGWFEVFDARGAAVYRSSPVGVACVREPPPPALLRPGRSQLWSDETWDGLGPYVGVCKPGNCHPSRTALPAGRYRITWNWLSTVSVRTDWFELRSG